MAEDRKEVVEFGRALDRDEQPDIEQGGRLAGSPAPDHAEEPGHQGKKPEDPGGGHGKPDDPGAGRRKPPRGRSHGVL